MRIAITGDTHLPRGARRLPPRAVELIAAADLVLHTGDWVRPEVIDDIAAIGPPLRGVHGNVDDAAVRARMPARLQLELDGVSVALTHDAGPAAGRLARMRARFPGADAVLFGHSHIPLHEEREGFQIFNPGSPTDRRRQPVHTMGLATIAGGTIAFELVEL